MRRVALLLAGALVIAPAAGARAAPPAWFPPKSPGPGPGAPVGEGTPPLEPTTDGPARLDPLDPCRRPLVAAPLAPAILESGLDRLHGACLSRGLSFRAALAGDRDAGPVDRDRAASATVELRGLALADLELAIGVRAAADHLDDGWTPDDRDAGFGPVYVAAAADRAARLLDRPLHLGWSLRLDLPGTRTGAVGPIVAASPQIAAALAVTRDLTVHGHVGALVGLAFPPDDVDTRRAAAVSLDLTHALGDHVAAGAGLAAQTGWHGAALDHMMGRAGLRLRVGHTRIDIAGAARLAGREPVDVAAELTLAIDG